MIQFSRLRLNGFKSFVDKTELDISKGLTGIVGPNGCGKSNLVEALRWSMGETSAKRMRGGSGSMDDVIFNGTEKRPARNFAEVTVVLDNTTHTAPGPYNETDEIEVIRRIEREKGSDYKINSKPVRAKDVNLLYADLMSGAHSPYLVSQGKVTNLIQAKPQDRKQILEEAAGITGLYARRHEAELRLRAADNNLKRLEEIVGGMESRLQDLKKQSRQASRYRNLSAQIRQLEVMIASMEWQKAHEKLAEVQAQFDEIEKQVAERMIVVSQLTRTQDTQAADLPALRKTDAEIGATLQTQRLSMQRLEDEAARIQTLLSEGREQLAQIAADTAHEEGSLTENTETLEAMAREEEQLTASQQNQEKDLAERTARQDDAQSVVSEMESAYAFLLENLATERARRESIDRQIAADQSRLEAVVQKLAMVAEQIARREAEIGDSVSTQSLSDSVAALESDLVRLQDELQNNETALNEARAARDMAREALQERKESKAKIEAEIQALEAVLNIHDNDTFRPVIEDIQAESGFETALSRALGDTLMASTDSGAPVSWNPQGLTAADLPSLPAGTRALSDHVKAPEALRLALSQIGYVSSEEQGRVLAAQLRVGQSLVTGEGHYWRWDGLQVKAEAGDRHAIQLRQKNQLAELKDRLPAAVDDYRGAEDVMARVEQDVAAAQAAYDNSRTALRDLDNSLRAKRQELNRAIEEQASTQADFSRLREAQANAEGDRMQLEESLKAARESRTIFESGRIEELQTQVDEKRQALTEARAHLQECLLRVDQATQEQNRRMARLHAIADERINLQNRSIRARDRLKELADRREALDERLTQNETRPGEIDVERQELLSRMTVTEQEKAVAADALAKIEAELAETQRGLKEAETLLAEAREVRAHATATIGERQTHLEELRTHIQEQFSMSPEDLRAEAAIDPENLPDLEEMKAEREKSIRSRDQIGPVNLCADQEAEEMEKQLSGIFTERNDLVEAISALRDGINTLNVEARERLVSAFNQVNEHFQHMFIRLFNGGKAHLSLIESDDPLEAGLEIFAQPPGKALQSLSLLSGGEQTLTAVALIFAMFLTNPSPICVLDEVDAPLDDANVDRFCDVLKEFAEKGQTRFLIITHHRLTMARMDRLYGVTMAEKGVSQLISLDLNEQLDFLEAA